MKTLLHILSICFYLLSTNSFAQIKEIRYISKDSLYNKTIPVEKQNIKATHKRFYKNLEDTGYFFYVTDSIQIQNTIETHYINLGPKTTHLYIKNIPNEIKDTFTLKNNVFNLKDSKALLNNINLFYENQGRSFTKTELDNFTRRNDTLVCELRITESLVRKINKTTIKGYTKFSKGHIKHFLKDSKPFSNNTLTKIEQKLQQLSFVESYQKPAVLFTKDSTQLYLYLKKKNANKIDALIGFTNDENQDKLQFTGHLDLMLKNTLHKGETFSFLWKSTTNQQQEINLEIKRPYIFNTILSPEYRLNIYRQDSSFVNTKSNINLNFTIQQHSIGAFYDTETSSITNNNSTLKSFEKFYLGISHKFTSNKNLHQQPIFTSTLKLGTGTKTQVTETAQQLFESDLTYNLNLSNLSTLHTRNRNGYIRSSNLTSNEFFRLGGANSIRGFLEQSIFSYLYNYTTIEYRYFTDSNSYLYGFSDFGEFRDLSQKNQLISFGLGYTMQIKSSLIKMSYALGKNQNTDFNPSEGLFHFNIVTLF